MVTWLRDTANMHRISPVHYWVPTSRDVQHTHWGRPRKPCNESCRDRSSGASTTDGQDAGGRTACGGGQAEQRGHQRKGWNLAGSIEALAATSRIRSQGGGALPRVR